VLPSCENCGRPAAYIWTLSSGRDAVSCGKCRPANGIASRHVGAADAVPAAPPPPLTVAQAATREAVSTRTIHRWLPALAAAGGAWKAGAQWRIDPAALAARPAALAARRVAPRPARERARRPRRPARSGPADGGWPA